MNFLAHSYLSKKSDEAIIGNIIADFVKGRLKDQYPKAILEGVSFHRKIDGYTDSHPLFISCKQYISEKNRRFSGAILDIFFDHFLSLHWNRYCDTPIEEYSQNIYSILESSKPILPEQFQQILPRMIKNNWFVAYAKVKVIGYALENISSRISRKNHVAESINDLKKNYKGIEKNFFIFFEDLKKYALSLQKEDDLQGSYTTLQK